MSARSDPQSYYRVLGVSHTATADEIRLAFRARAMESHPDQAGDRGDAETFRLIREAYEVLRDPRRRMAYDASGLAAWERAPGGETGWADGADDLRRASSGATGRGPGPTYDNRFEATIDAEPRPSNGAGPGPGDGSGPHASGNGAAYDPAFASAGRASARPRRRKATRAGSSRLWPLVAAGLALLLLVVLGSLWSAHRQLDDRQGIVADLYERLSRMGEEQAELRSRYRSLALLDLERALRLGAAASSSPITADTGRAAYRFDVAFAGGSADLGPSEAPGLARALVEIAGQIDRLPPEAEWLIVIEAQAARAAYADQVAVESWEPALFRLATVLDELLAQGLPGERIAIRFNAGFAQIETLEALSSDALPSAATGPDPFDRVSIQLLCCVE